MKTLKRLHSLGCQQITQTAVEQARTEPLGKKVKRQLFQQNAKI